MSSSISASDLPGDAAWGRWLATCLLVAAVITAALYAGVLLMDPYSTGRFTPIARVDITSDRAFYTHAARVRNPSFDSAIIGNSHIMPVRPSRLDAAMGGAFVNLALPGATPNEQAFLVRVFARHHRKQTRFLVWSIDEVWCSADPGFRTAATSPLPYWLYQSSDAEYLSRILSPDALSLSLRRAEMLLGLEGQAGPVDWFGPTPAALWARGQPVNAPRLAAMQQPTKGEPVEAPMPALPVLAQVLSQLDPRIRVIIVTPPVFARFLPLPGSMAEERDAACHKGIAPIAAARAGTAVLDLRVDSALTRDQTNFLDETHYSDLVAQFVEGEIANATGGAPR